MGLTSVIIYIYIYIYIYIWKCTNMKKTLCLLRIIIFLTIFILTIKSASEYIVFLSYFVYSIPSDLLPIYIYICVCVCVCVYSLSRHFLRIVMMWNRWDTGVWVEYLSIYENFFYFIQVSRWSFTGVWVTASFLRSPALFSISWLTLPMMYVVPSISFQTYFCTGI